MSAYRHANDGFRRYTGLLQHLANTATIGLPQLVHIPLHVSGPRGNHWCIPGGRTDLVPFQVKQRGFRYRPPVVQTEPTLEAAEPAAAEPVEPAEAAETGAQE